MRFQNSSLKAFSTIRFYILLGLIFFLAWVPPMRVDPGITEPASVGPYLNGKFTPSRPIGNVTFTIDKAFPKLNFYTPFKMQKDPTRNRFFLAEKRGRIVVFDKANGGTNKRTVLNIEKQVSQGEGAHGFMGFVLHPEFGQTNSPNKGYFYVFYRYIPDESMLTGEDESYRRLSRFTYNESSGTASPSSEVVLIQQFVTSRIHTGGGMVFGDDGFLYVGIGDGGICCEQISTQRLDRFLLAGIFRIDVDRRGGNISHPIRRQPTNYGDIPQGWPQTFSANYYIPNDNPWIDPNGGVLEEYYALGIRHPYTLSFDPVRKEIWEGDVGELTWEEVNKIQKGGNYEWPFLEADNVHRSSLGYTPRNINQVTGTRRSYFLKLNRATSNSVIGGFVYRGTKYPSLYGKYILADHNTGRIWTIDADKQGQYTQDDLTLLAVVPNTSAGSGIASFATDETGEVYIVKLRGVRAYGNNGGGEVLRLKPQGEQEEERDPPRLLSQTGAFSDLPSLTPSKGVIPYTVNSPLWSDGATKKRWIAIPNNGSHNSASEQVNFDAEGEWTYPEGTVLIKHFELPTDDGDPTQTTRLETRFLILGKGGEYYALTYKWNAQQTDAELLEEGDTRNVSIRKKDGGTRQQTWHFPSRTECFSCHTETAGRVLGIKAHQLNGTLTYPQSGVNANQLETWNHLNIFRNDIGAPDQYTQSAKVGKAGATLQHQVRSYLDVNCSFCHRPGGVEARFDARLSTPIQETGIILGDLAGSASTPGNVVVAPGNPAKSELWVRSTSSAGNLMPPLGRSVLDEEYLSALQTWILNMNPTHTEWGKFGESGWVETNHTWKTVNLEQRYQDPVVIIGTPSHNGVEQATTRVRNVTANSFEVKIDEWESCLDQAHAPETFSYLVLEAGTYELPNGKKLVAGNTELNHEWQSFDLPIEFDSAPMVFASCVTEHEADAVVVRMDKTDEPRRKLRFRLQEQEGGGVNSPPEDLDRVTLADLSGDLLKNTAGVKRALVPLSKEPCDTMETKSLVSKKKLKKIQEEAYERINAHSMETVSWLAIEPGINQIGGEFEVGNLEEIGSTWKRVPFRQYYSEKPLVWASIGSFNESDPVSLRYDLTQLQGGAIRIFAEEDPCGDIESSHIPETVHFLIAEPGMHLYGKRLQVTEPGSSRLVDVTESPEPHKPTFHFFPNPAKEFIVCELKKELCSSAIIEIYNSDGKRVLRRHGNSQTLRISVNHLPKGLYIMQVQSDSFTKTEKLMLE